MGMVINRSSVPEVRSRRVVTDVIRNMITSGKMPSSGAPIWSKIRPPVVDPPQQRHQQRGDGDEQRHRPVVVADLGEHALGRGQRQVRVHAVLPSASGSASTGQILGRSAGRCLDPVVDQVQEDLLGVGLAGQRLELRQGPVGEELGLAEQEQPVAARGLIHDVAGHEQGDAAVGEAPEEVPQVPAQHGIEPHRRLVEHQQLGAPEQRGGQRDPRALPPGERGHDLVGLRLQLHLLDDPIDVGAGSAQDLGEVPEVLADRTGPGRRWGPG